MHTRHNVSHTLEICWNEKKAKKSLFPLGESHMEGSVQFVFNAFIGVKKTKLWTGIIDSVTHLKMAMDFSLKGLTQKNQKYLPTEM
jgi:homoserine trans-succinylase